MTDRPAVSVLTVTRGRPRRLERLLGSIERLPPGTVRRVVVVDDSPEPVDLAARHPDLEMRHITSPERLFVSRAKNRGLREVTDPLVFFIDDDNVVDASTFRGPVDVLHSDAEIGAVMPAVLYDRHPELVWVYATPFLPGRWGFRLVGRNAPRNISLEGRLLRTDALPNASLVRRAVLEEVGGFDESLPVNSSADLCQRIQRAGRRTVADTRSFIRHDVDPPGVLGYWAQHSVDPDRLDREVADWFVFHRRLRSGGVGVRGRSLWHAAPFLLAIEVAFALRHDARWWPLSARLARGVLRGLGELPEPRYGLTGARDPAG